MNNQKNTIVIIGIVILVIIIAMFVYKGTVREIAKEEATNAISDYTKSFQPDPFGFGAAWEKPDRPAVSDAASRCRSGR